MDVFYPFCAHWHRKMPCNSEGTEQLQMIYVTSERNREEEGHE
jgi:hypothetical protein